MPNLGRPKPNVLDTHVDKKWNQTDICETQGVYLVLYMGKAFSLRRYNSLLDMNGPNNSAKYRVAMYGTKAHAKNAAAKLNIQFNCTHFKVVQLDPGTGSDV